MLDPDFFQLPLTQLVQPAINRPFIPTTWPHLVVQPLAVPRAPNAAHGVVFIPRQEIQAQLNRDVRALSLPTKGRIAR